MFGLSLIFFLNVKVGIRFTLVGEHECPKKGVTIFVVAQNSRDDLRVLFAPNYCSLAYSLYGLDSRSGGGSAAASIVSHLSGTLSFQCSLSMAAMRAAAAAMVDDDEEAETYAIMPFIFTSKIFYYFNNVT